MFGRLSDPQVPRILGGLALAVESDARVYRSQARGYLLS